MSSFCLTLPSACGCASCCAELNTTMGTASWTVFALYAFGRCSALGPCTRKETEFLGLGAAGSRDMRSVATRCCCSAAVEAASASRTVSATCTGGTSASTAPLSACIVIEPTVSALLVRALSPKMWTRRLDACATRDSSVACLNSPSRKRIRAMLSASAGAALDASFWTVSAPMKRCACASHSAPSRGGARARAPPCSADSAPATVECARRANTPSRSSAISSSSALIAAPASEGGPVDSSACRSRFSPACVPIFSVGTLRSIAASIAVVSASPSSTQSLICLAAPSPRSLAADAM
mmetsp:Transcript_15063/g.49401  ORF Transcript_15063/g.49401 Transcript_15063/m.49401 type:complete len:296 (-) Transcript_15063:754-1641(-)